MMMPRYLTLFAKANGVKGRAVQRLHGKGHIEMSLKSGGRALQKKLN